MRSTNGSFTRTAVAAVSALALLAAPVVSQAQTVLFNNLGPGDTFNASATVASYTSASNYFEVASPFVVGGSGTYYLTGVDLPLTITTGNVGFNLGIFSSTPAGVNSLLETLNFTGPVTNGTVTSVAASGQTVLTAGSKYWLALMPLHTQAQSIQWHRTPSAPQLEWSYRTQSSAPGWFYDNDNPRTAYRINGLSTSAAVPEPGTIALLGGMGAFGLLVAVRRRRA
jgi:hypothetical protein